MMDTTPQSSIARSRESVPEPAKLAVDAWLDVKGPRPLPVLKQAVTHMDESIRDWSSLMGYVGPSVYAFLLWGKSLPEFFGVPMPGQETHQFVDTHTHRRLAAVHHVIDNYRCGAILKIRGQSEACGQMEKTVTVLPFTHQHRPAAMWYGGTANGKRFPAGKLLQISGLASVRWIDLGAGAPGLQVEPLPKPH